jgi:hypothetical protein
VTLQVSLVFESQSVLKRPSVQEGGDGHFRGKPAKHK